MINYEVMKTKQKYIVDPWFIHSLLSSNHCPRDVIILGKVWTVKEGKKAFWKQKVTLSSKKHECI